MHSKKCESSCQCGAVKVSIAHRPEFMQDCNCSLCSNSGGVWGYFSTADVKVEGETKGYVRKDYPEPAVEIHFCNVCGATSHWVLTQEHITKTGQNDHMGVNMRLFKSEDLKGIELRFPDGKNWTGEGPFGFRRQSIILEEGDTL